MLSRHGVRGPYGFGEETPSEETFKKYVRNPNVDLPLDANSWGTSEIDDPTEIVSPKLTKHGYNVVKLMGEVSAALGAKTHTHTHKSSLRMLVRQRWSHSVCALMDAVLPQTPVHGFPGRHVRHYVGVCGCQPARQCKAHHGNSLHCIDGFCVDWTFVDGLSMRAQLTAQAFMTGLYPSCRDVVPITAETRLLFEQGEDPTANCPVCSRTGRWHRTVHCVLWLKTCVLTAGLLWFVACSLRRHHGVE